MATAKGLRSLSRCLRGESWGGGAAAIHAVRVEGVSPTRIASFDAMRPPPQAGEVQQVRGQADSTKNHPALVLLSQKAAAERAENRVLEQIHSDRRGLRWVDEGRIPARHDFRLT